MSDTKDNGGYLFPGVNRGISMREVFAAHAPDNIPAWFNPTIPDLPLVMSIDQALLDTSGFKELNEDDRNRVLDWLKSSSGPFLVDDELPQHLQDFASSASRLHLDSRRAYDEAKVERAARRYFMWRWFYADGMIMHKGADHA